MAEVKMAAVTSRFVYISRQRTDIISRVQAGEFLSLPLTPMDSPDRPRKFPSYILTRYPVDVDPRLAEGHQGVYSARRFIQNGSPINRIVVVWSIPDPPPSTMAFDFLPCLPPCEVRKLQNDQPWCFRCWGVGHISRYCSASPKCAWCAAAHDTRTCPVKNESSRPAASTSSDLQPPKDVSLWKCPRCLQPGVNVWHGCARRQAPLRTSSTASPPPPLPPLSNKTANPTDSASPQDVALRKAISSLQARVTTMEDRFSALDARINELVAAQAATASKLNTMVEAQEAVVTVVSSLTEKMDTICARLEKLYQTPPASAMSPSGCSSTSTPHRSHFSKGKIRR
ncbi:uncharacterized protein LOC127009444 [Eriocheir sinensis]|uniref:uncharacterized protein LOC127009444 n=1 Tax=Eriocheir sinensis TaxID=95602 RepID=UPI0021CA8801|nr:uncharacterized protein LOC127009444 [Eriocheir sinensis]